MTPTINFSLDRNMFFHLRMQFLLMTGNQLAATAKQPIYTPPMMIRRPSITMR